MTEAQANCETSVNEDQPASSPAAPTSAGLLGVVAGGKARLVRALNRPDIPEPAPELLQQLNSDWTVTDELERQDSMSTALLQLSVLGTTASASVAAAAHVGRFRLVFIVAAVSLSVPVSATLFALAQSPLARVASELGPWRALQLKLKWNRFALYTFFLVVYLAAVAGLTIGLT